MDNILRKDQLTLEESLNVEADELADGALRWSVREKQENKPGPTIRANQGDRQGDRTKSGWIGS